MGHDVLGDHVPAIVSANAPNTYRLNGLYIQNTEVLRVEQRYVFFVQLEV